MVGSGNFSLDQLATFTGFERVTLDNAIGSSAQLTLGSQAIEVDATGNLSISVNSPSNWNGSDVINGDASVPYATTTLSFNNYQVAYPPLPVTVTYDLTSNAFSHVGVYGNGDNITLLINNADTTGVKSFNAFGQGDRLVTAGSTLDLSHTTVSGFTVASTNAMGTTFTVGDLGTALQIAGGSGHDTLIAQGLTLTATQRTEIFATSSIETITDQTGTYEAPPAPTIAGTVSGLTTTSEAAVKPFAGVTIGDANFGATDTLTITLGGAGGTLSGTGLSGGTGGVYTLSGTAAAITSELHALVFTPKAGAPNTSSPTTFTLSDQSSAGGAPVVDNNDQCDRHRPGGGADHCRDGIWPDDDVGDAGQPICRRNDRRRQLRRDRHADDHPRRRRRDAARNGLSGGTGGVYTLSGTAAAITSELDALVFTPGGSAQHVLADDVHAQRPEQRRRRARRRQHDQCDRHRPGGGADHCRDASGDDDVGNAGQPICRRNDRRRQLRRDRHADDHPRRRRRDAERNGR